MIFSLLFGGEEPGFVPVISKLEHVGHWAVAALGDGPVAPEFSPSSLSLGLQWAGPIHCWGCQSLELDSAIPRCPLLVLCLLIQ